MWFITALVDSKETSELLDRRFGFFDVLWKAEAAIKENRCNMHEYLYQYLVLEKIGPGIHPDVEETIWYKWDNKNEKWVKTPKSKIPIELSCATNFAIG
jgi:hypothetical protein